MPCPAVRIMLPSFLDRTVLKSKWPQALKTPWCRKWDQPVAPFSWQTGPFLPLLHFVAFSHTERFLQTAVPRPRGGKRAENRMWIHPRLTNTLAETLCCRASCPDLPTWFTSCFFFTETEFTETRGICICSKQTMRQPYLNYFTLQDWGTVVLICTMLRWNKAALSRN